MRHSCRHRGLTLIEVMVVVTLILILVGLLMPKMQNLQRTLKETICATDTRKLLEASLVYAMDNRGRMPDLTTRPNGNVDSSNIYWSWPYWRDYFEEAYGLQRIHWYSPSNPKWSLDRFYYWGWNGVDPKTSTHFVMGRYYMAASQTNTKEFYDKLVDRPADLKAPLFPRWMDDREGAYYKMVWMDLTRQWPGGATNNWVTPGDPDRWGANHLYAADYTDPNSLWPSGAHVGYLGGHVLWTPGADIKYRLSWKNNSVDIYW